MIWRSHHVNSCHWRENANRYSGLLLPSRYRLHRRHGCGRRTSLRSEHPGQRTRINFMYSFLWRKWSKWMCLFIAVRYFVCHPTTNYSTVGNYIIEQMIFFCMHTHVHRKRTDAHIREEKADGCKSDQCNRTRADTVPKNEKKIKPKREMYTKRTMKM